MSKELARIQSIFDVAANYLRRGFCHEALARNCEGDPVRIYSEKACQWCILGAVGMGRTVKKAYIEDETLLINVMHYVCRCHDKDGVASFNDSHTQEECINFLRDCKFVLDKRIFADNWNPKIPWPKYLAAFRYKVYNELVNENKS